MLEAEECLSHDALNASSSGISPQLEDSELFDVANLRRWLEKSSLSPDAVIFWKKCSRADRRDGQRRDSAVHQQNKAAFFFDASYAAVPQGRYEDPGVYGKMKSHRSEHT